MNNVQLYNLVCSLKDRLENHPDSTKNQIVKAMIKIEEVNHILDTVDRRQKR